jgi:hypothetical protein
MTPTGLAEGPVFVLLLLFLSEEDFGWISVAIRWCIRVRHTDIEDRNSPTPPEAVHGDIASEFGGGFCAVGPSHLHVPTNLDEWFVGDTRWGKGLAAQLAPLRRNIVVALEDQPTFAAGHGVLGGKPVATPVASVGKGLGEEPQSKPEAVPKFVYGEIGAIEQAGHGIEPCPRLRRPHNAPFVGRSGIQFAAQGRLLASSDRASGRRGG